MVRTSNVRTPQFNFIEYIGSLLGFAGVIIMMVAGVQYIQAAPFELGLLSLGIGLSLGLYIAENDLLSQHRTDYAPLALLVATVLVLGGIGTLLVHPQIGLIELSTSATEMQTNARIGLRVGGVLTVAGIALTAIGDYLRV